MTPDAAPPPGWYPDPVGGVRLRWWDGTDWTDRYRARPSSKPKVVQSGAAPGTLFDTPDTRSRPLTRGESEELVSQVRQAARAEIERAADLFSTRARAARRDIEPLISQYTSQFARLFKRAVLLAFVIVVAWFVFQMLVQASFFNWLGDRIDNITDNQSAPALVMGWWPGGR